MGNQMTGARFIAETLRAYEVDQVFLIPAILRRGLVEIESVGIRRIVAHSEKGAAYMADGYARVSHKPGVIMAQSVGAANLAAGLQDAYLGHTPLIAITGRKAPTAQYRNAYQEIIHGPMFEPVTKYNVNVDSVDQLPCLLAQAFREATSGAPRPVHLDLLGLAGEAIESASTCVPVMADPRYRRAPSTRVEPPAGDIGEAARLIAAADRPVIVAGGGAMASGANRQILRLAESLQVPVATSATGRSIIPTTHPLSAGVVGSYSMRCANQIVSEADLVIYVGCSVGDQVTHDWRIPREGTQIIQIDIEASELGLNYRRTHGVLGDATVSVSRLADALSGAQPKSEWAAHCQQRVRAWRKDIEPLLASTALPMRPERLCRELASLLPANVILVADTGYSTIWSSTMIDLPHPEQSYYRAAGSLGWAFPASLGAKCAAPDRPVVCFTGDGGFWYHIAELETARRRHIHTVTIVNNNSGLGQSRGGTRRAYADSPGKPEEIYCFERTNFARVADAMGCRGFRVESPEELGPAFRDALESDSPAVIDVVTEMGCTVPALWEPDQA